VGNHQSDDAPWLQTQASGNTVVVGVNQSGLNNGVYSGTVTISAIGNSGIPSVSAQVQLIVVDQSFPVYLPLIRK
jgi:hypothetical protein